MRLNLLLGLYAHFLKLKEVTSGAKSDLAPAACTTHLEQITAFESSTEELQTEMAVDGKIMHFTW